MDPEFERIIDECLVQLRAGKDINTCLAAYPEQDDALRPLLITAARAQSVPLPKASAKAVLNGKDRMMAAFTAQNQARKAPFLAVSFHRFTHYKRQILNIVRIILIGKETKGMKFALRLALSMTVIMIIAGALTVNASASSLPGDILYNVKRSWEDVRLNMTFDSQARTSLQNQFQNERHQEVQHLTNQHRSATFDIFAKIESMADDQWVIGGFVVQITSTTEIIGTPNVGSLVWLRVRITEEGSLTALIIHVVPDVLPTPGFTITPRPTRTPGPTKTPRPTRTAIPTHEPRPTYGPWPTPEPWPTFGPWPILMPWPTPEPRPTHVPWPTPEPKPTNVPWPTPEPKPTHAPKPPYEPTCTPEITPTPVITATPSA